MNRLVLIILFTLCASGGCSRSNEPVPDKGKILVLMYHRISPGEPANEYERSVTAFENDLLFLKNNSINILSFSDLQDILTSGKMPAGNSVILTFDDGDQS